MEATSTRDNLREAWLRARSRAECAASNLAYDVTFRAESPDAANHQQASPTLTAHLKAAFMDAHGAEQEAFAAWDKA